MDKPHTFNGDLGNLPPALRHLTAEHRWVVWSWEPRRGKDGEVKWTKPPYQARFPTQHAKSNDPKTWGPYADALAAVETGGADGIGFMLQGSGLGAIDLDRCRDPNTGKLADWAEALHVEANGAYHEVTVSGTGTRIIGTAGGPRRMRRFNLDGEAGIELFRDSERYITISGLEQGTCAELPSIDRLIDALEERYDARGPAAASPFDFSGSATQATDFDSLIRSGAPGGQRSEAFQAAVWHLAGRGLDKSAIVGELARHPAGIGAKYAGRLAEEVARSYGKWLAKRRDGGGEPPPASLYEWDAGEDSDPIPPRGWLLGNQFCRKFLSSLIAPGGTGKTALRTLQYLSLATGRPLTGQFVFQRSRVLMLSLEDDRDEMRRRIRAACIHHGIDQAELKGWLFCAAPKGLKLAEMKGGTRQIGHLEKLLRESIERRKPELVGFDPFIKTHALEENDNGAMDFVCDILTKLGIKYDIAIDAPHHTRKGALIAGDADNGRGGSGMRDAARIVSTLTTMGDQEAKMFGISEIDRHDYVRLDPAKVNITRKSQKATWFKLVGVKLGNATGQYPAGDEVQTVQTWTPPDTWADLPTAALNAALAEIDAGMSNGQRYSDAPNAKDRAAWAVVQRHCPSKTEAQCREIIRTWVRNGVLYNKDYSDPIKREDCMGLYLDATKRPE
jgi:hypothetical protein